MSQGSGTNDRMNDVLDYINGFDMHERLVQLRMMRGMSVTEAAEVVQVEECQYLQLERNTSSNSNEGLNSVQVYMLCKALDMDLNGFFKMEVDSIPDFTEVDFSVETVQLLTEIMEQLC